MRGALFAACAALLATPGLAAKRDAPAIQALQQRDAQLFAVGWRLASRNAAFCENAIPALGLAILDAGAFAAPDAIRRQLGLTGDLAIGAVAPGSPAAAAGLQANDTLLGIDGAPLAPRFPRAKPAWQRLVAVSVTLDAAAARGPVALLVATGAAAPRTIVIDPTPACPTRFEVLDGGGAALAEGTRVIFGRDFVGFSYPEAQFAAAVAHELAHNLLRHRVMLDAKGRTQGNIRITEREADRLTPWLLANAGYDPGAAPAFMRRWGPRHGGGVFRKRTHDGWDERVDAIAAEAVVVAQAMAREGRADWARQFRREAWD